MSSSDSERSYKAYVYAMLESMDLHLSGLDQLQSIAVERELSFNERAAVERNLQVLVEGAIGCSKHYLKNIGLPVPAMASAAIERVYESTGMQSPARIELRGAVGMRNAIVHDYLNLDWTKLERVLKAKKYYAVASYIKAVCEKLL